VNFVTSLEALAEIFGVPVPNSISKLADHLTAEYAR